MTDVKALIERLRGSRTTKEEVELMDQAAAALEKHHNEITDLLAANMDLTARLEAMEKSLKAADVYADAEIKRLQAELAEHKTLNAELIKRVDLLRKELAEERKYSARLLSILDERKAQLSEERRKREEADQDWRAQYERWRAEIGKQATQIGELSAKYEAAREAFEEYGVHADRCVLRFWEAGEPTADGGYRSKFAGKWYQSKPIDETPKCTCGLDEIAAKLAKGEGEGR